MNQSEIDNLIAASFDPEEDQKRTDFCFEQVICLLRQQSGYSRCIRDLELITADTLPLIMQARASGGPALHTGFVAETVVKIAMAENLSPESIAILFLAAVFHDVGFANIPEDRKKIRKSQIDDEPDPKKREELRKKAIEIRLEHMDLGAEMVEQMFLKDREWPSKSLVPYPGCDWPLWERIPLAQVCVPSLIRIHDYPTIAEYVDSYKEKAMWLFSSPLPKPGKKPVGSKNLVILLREADRLWMLSFDGLIADLAAAKPEKRKSLADQLTHNLKRHIEEGELYRTVQRELKIGKIDGLDPAEGQPFYRTAASKGLAKQLEAETRERIAR